MTEEPIRPQLPSPAIDAASQKLAEIKEIVDARPSEAKTLRTATLEEIFCEVVARIGHGEDAQSAFYMGWCDGTLPAVRTVQYAHGSKDHIAAVLADILAKIPKQLREYIAFCEERFRKTTVEDGKTVLELRAQRAARKAAEFRKRNPGAS